MVFVYSSKMFSTFWQTFFNHSLIHSCLFLQFRPTELSAKINSWTSVGQITSCDIKICIKNCYHSIKLLQFNWLNGINNQLTLKKIFWTLFMLYKMELRPTCAGSSSTPGFSKSSRCASGFSFHNSSSLLICCAEIWRARSCSASEGTFTSQDKNCRSWIRGCHWVGSQFMSWSHSNETN